MRLQVKLFEVKKRTPFSAVHWTLLFRCRRSDPFEQAMHMEHMGAFSPDCQNGLRVMCYIDFCDIQKNVLNGQSSPGILQDGQHPSYGTRQIPQTSPSLSSSCSGLPVSQRHCATACHRLTITFMCIFWHSKTS